MEYIRKTFTLDKDAAEKLKKLQKIDGFNASYVVRTAIKKAYEEMVGLNNVFRD